MTTTHPLARTALPENVQRILPAPYRGDWQQHDNFLVSNARSLLRNHNSLKAQANTFHRQLILQLETADLKTGPNNTGGNDSPLAATGKQLLRNLHSHHGYEDSSVFPVLRRDHPRLGAGFDLLEADHRQLEVALATMALHVQRLASTPLSESVLDAASHHAEQLVQILHRHMSDEEDIIMPLYLTYM